MRNYLLVFVFAFGIAALWTRPAAAHVLIRDSTANIGAVLHLNPDDDPVAGQASELYFDLQDKNSQVRLSYEGYQLIVTDENGVSAEAALTASGSTLAANYTFPGKGLYMLTLRSKPSYEQFIKVSMNYSLRVSRGVDNGAVPTPQHSTATLIAVGSAAGCLVLAILAFNNRRDIARHSKF